MQNVIKCQKLFIVFTFDATRISFGKDLALDVDSFLDNLVDPILAGEDRGQRTEDTQMLTTALLA